MMMILFLLMFSSTSLCMDSLKRKYEELVDALHGRTEQRAEPKVEQRAEQEVQASFDLASLNYGIAQMQGRRRSMEDAHCIKITDQDAFFGLYDGHGGREVADFAAAKLHSYCKLAERRSAEDIAQGLAEGFVKTHEALDDPSEHEKKIVQAGGYDLTFEGGINAQRQGCTALVVFIRNDQLFVANAGDSRAVLSKAGKAIPLSDDHKAGRADEKERVQMLGGTLEARRTAWYIRKYDYGLAVSRSLGDKALHPYVIPCPEIKTKRVRSNNEFVIMACDGVWDVLDNQTAVSMVSEALKQKPKDFNHAAQILMQKAYDAGSTDNISVIVVGLQNKS